MYIPNQVYNLVDYSSRRLIINDGGVPDVGDADLAAEVDEDLVLDDVHLALELLDLVGAFVHHLLDRLDARLVSNQTDNKSIKQSSREI